MRLRVPQTSNIENTKDFIRLASQTIDSVVSAINGKIGVTDNLDAAVVSAEFQSANSTTPIAHTLGRTPIGYIVTGLSANMVVFDGSGTNNESTLFLQASAAGTARMLVF